MNDTLISPTIVCIVFDGLRQGIRIPWYATCERGAVDKEQLHLNM